MKKFLLSLLIIISLNASEIYECSMSRIQNKATGATEELDNTIKIRCQIVENKLLTSLQDPTKRVIFESDYIYSDKNNYGTPFKVYQQPNGVTHVVYDNFKEGYRSVSNDGKTFYDFIGCKIVK